MTAPLVQEWIYKHAWMAHKAGYSTGQCWEFICHIVHNYSRENSVILSKFPAPWLDAVLMVAHRLRHWTNFNPTLGQCFLCSQGQMVVWLRQMHADMGYSYSVFVFICIRSHFLSIHVYSVFMINYEYKYSYCIQILFWKACIHEYFFNTLWIHVLFPQNLVNKTKHFPNCFYYLMGIQKWYDLSYFLRAVAPSLRFYKKVL